MTCEAKVSRAAHRQIGRPRGGIAASGRMAEMRRRNFQQERPARLGIIPPRRLPAIPETLAGRPSLARHRPAAPDNILTTEVL